jgi:hypothetical protein
MIVFNCSFFLTVDDRELNEDHPTLLEWNGDRIVIRLS